MISFRRGDPESRKPFPFIGCEKTVGDVHHWDWLPTISQLTPRERQGSGNGTIPWHLHTFYYEQRMSVPSCNGDCEGGSSHYVIANEKLLFLIKEYQYQVAILLTDNFVLIYVDFAINDQSWQIRRHKVQAITNWIFQNDMSALIFSKSAIFKK